MDEGGDKSSPLPERRFPTTEKRLVQVGLTLDGMLYGIPVYGMSLRRMRPPAEVGLPVIEYLKNFARVGGQPNQED